MRKALKGSLAAAAGIALGLGVGGTAPAQEEGEAITPFAAGDVTQRDGVGLYGSIDGSEKDVYAQMLSLELGDGDERVVYCIQINVDLLEGSNHEERAWDDVPVADLPLVLGVLLNGYNGDNADALVEAAGVGGENFETFSADQIAYAGTQAAVWSLTDDWEIGYVETPDPSDIELAEPGDPTMAGEGVDNAVSGIQTYLLENTEPVEEPDMEPHFDYDRSEAEVDGATVGPFSISTNLGSVTFQQPEGATIVDENGEPISEFADGQTFYVEFDEEETSSVTVVTDTVTWVTPVGRAFVPVDENSETLEGQNLILGESHEEPIDSTMEFDITVEDVPSETPPAPPKLPETGTDLTMVAGVGGAVLVAGVVALVLMRRRAVTAGGDWGDDKN
ncbi:thioester domain-containing protein [Glycomyces sp. L485]|nr:thioester domain-containing protein [Glycomyces sp. L485]